MNCIHQNNKKFESNNHIHQAHQNHFTELSCHIQFALDYFNESRFSSLAYMTPLSSLELNFGCETGLLYGGLYGT